MAHLHLHSQNTATRAQEMPIETHACPFACGIIHIYLLYTHTHTHASTQTHNIRAHSQAHHSYRRRQNKHTCIYTCRCTLDTHMKSLIVVFDCHCASAVYLFTVSAACVSTPTLCICTRQLPSIHTAIFIFQPVVHLPDALCCSRLHLAGCTRRVLLCRFVSSAV